MKIHLSCRHLLVTLVALGAAAQCGCRSDASSDLYRQKMAREIRLLEDQLYEADYQNDVLQDKLQRQRELNAALQAEQVAPDVEIDVDRPRREKPKPSPDPAIGLKPVPPLEKDADGEARRSAEPPPSTEPDVDQTLELELELPEMDPGVPVDPATEVPREPAAETGPDAKASQETPDKSSAPLKDPVPLREDASPVEEGPSSENRPEKAAESEGDLLPAPTEPQPPSKEDTELPLEIPGEILPPPASPEEIKPPGQIQLPDSVQASDTSPKSLRIHRGLSGGHRVDGRLDGMTIVVNVVDGIGKTLDLKQFNIDAELSVVVLDPERDPDKARIGRWDFDREKVLQLVRDQPISGLHIPVQWEQEPEGDEVIVHVRLRAEEDEMRCEERLPVEATPAVAAWTPRGDELPADSKQH